MIVNWRRSRDERLATVWCRNGSNFPLLPEVQAWRKRHECSDSENPLAGSRVCDTGDCRRTRWQAFRFRLRTPSRGGVETQEMHHLSFADCAGLDGLRGGAPGQTHSAVRFMKYG